MLLKLVKLCIGELHSQLLKGFFHRRGHRSEYLISMNLFFYMQLFGRIATFLKNIKT